MYLVHVGHEDLADGRRIAYADFIPTDTHEFTCWDD